MFTAGGVGGAGGVGRVGGVGGSGQRVNTHTYSSLMYCLSRNNCIWRDEFGTSVKVAFLLIGERMIFLVTLKKYYVLRAIVANGGSGK